jgi:hypothetical protein
MILLLTFLTCVEVGKTALDDSGETAVTFVALDDKIDIEVPIQLFIT